MFADATDILSGYKRVRVFDTSLNGDYYYKAGPGDFQLITWGTEKPEAATGEQLKAPYVDSLDKFAAALTKYGLVYVKLVKDGAEIGCQEGFDPAAGITTLEEYFFWLRTLANIQTGGADKGEEISASNIEDYGARFTALPLDKEPFDIDLNTRGITIPSLYKKSGIGVRSDDIAETLYFRVDRYFDYMDLSTCDIYIQWETPAGTDANKVAVPAMKGVSVPHIRDIASEPGKLIFSWPISRDMTQVAGQLKFSVRFFQWPEDTDERVTDASGNTILAYSLSTLIAKVAIQTSIDFNLEDKDSYVVDEAIDRILQRIRQSEISGGHAAATPVWLDGYDLSYDSGVAGDTNLTTEQSYHDFVDVNGEETEGRFLRVAARSTDTGGITYTWKRKLYDDETNELSDKIDYLTSGQITNIYEEVENPKDMVSTETYYISLNYDTQVGEYPVEKEFLDEEPIEPDEPVDVESDSEEYEEYEAAYAAWQVTHDAWEAKRKEVEDYNNAIDTKREEWQENYEAYCSDSKNFAQYMVGVNGNTIPPTSDDDGNYKYRFFARRSQCEVDHAGVYFVTAENRITNSMATINSKEADFPPPKAVVITKQDTNAKLEDGSATVGVTNTSYPNTGVTYQWYSNTGNYGYQDQDVSREHYTLMEGKTGSDLNVETPGRYFVKVTNHRNMLETTAESEAIRVTNAPEVPDYTMKTQRIGLANEELDKELENHEIVLEVTIPNSMEADKYHYQWFVKDNEFEGAVTEVKSIEKVANGVTTISFRPWDYSEEIFALTEDEDILGRYYVVVSTELNSFKSENTEVPSLVNMFEIYATGEETYEPIDFDEALEEVVENVADVAGNIADSLTNWWNSRNSDSDEE